MPSCKIAVTGRRLVSSRSHLNDPPPPFPPKITVTKEKSVSLLPPSVILVSRNRLGSHLQICYFYFYFKTGTIFLQLSFSSKNLRSALTNASSTLGNLADMSISILKLAQSSCYFPTTHNSNFHRKTSDLP